MAEETIAQTLRNAGGNIEYSWSDGRYGSANFDYSVNRILLAGLFGAGIYGGGVGIGKAYSVLSTPGAKFVGGVMDAAGNLLNTVVPISKKIGGKYVSTLADTVNFNLFSKNIGGSIRYPVSGKTVSIPQSGNLNSASAADWAIEQIVDLKTLLNPTDNLRVQAEQAVKMTNDLIQTARTSIFDRRVIEWLEKQSNKQLLDFDDRVAAYADKYGGDVLYRKIIDDVFDTDNMKKMIRHQGACFVAGTLVHTDKGLVPIDQIKVGDRVLSRDENNPDGENAYKRVLSTFKSAEKQRIIYQSFITRHGTGYLFCTEDHPFWADRLIEHKIDENGVERLFASRKVGHLR